MKAQNTARTCEFLPPENEPSRQWLLLRNDCERGIYAYACEVGLSRSMVSFIDPDGLDAIPGGGVGRGGEAGYGIPDGTKIFTGEASYYNLPGRKTANGEIFDPDEMTAAMTAEKVPHLPTYVYVEYTFEDPNCPGGIGKRTVKVKVNDRGPFAVDENGKAIHPLEPHPDRVIDLSPESFDTVVGTRRPGHVPVQVIVEPE